MMPAIKNLPRSCSEPDLASLTSAPKSKSDAIRELFARNRDAIYEGIKRMDRFGWPLLHRAVACEDVALVENLLEVLGKEEINQESRKPSAVTPLHLAAISGRAESMRVLETLIGSPKLDVNQCYGRAKNSILHKLVCSETEEGRVNRSSLDVFCRLLKIQGIDVNQLSKNKTPPLLLAVIEGRQPWVEALLGDLRIEVNQRTRCGRAAIHEAVFASIEIFRAVASHRDADIHLGDNGRLTPLHLAALGGRAEHVKFLLGIDGIKIRLVDKRGRTPLDVAIEYQRTAASPEKKKAYAEIIYALNCALGYVRLQ